MIRIGRSNVDPIPPIPDEITTNSDHQEITTKLSISIPNLTWILFLETIPTDMADIQNNLPAALSASSVAAGGSAEQSMDTSELGSVTGGSGGRANLIAGSSTSGIAKLMPAQSSLKTMHLTFKKKMLSLYVQICSFCNTRYNFNKC